MFGVDINKSPIPSPVLPIKTRHVVSINLSESTSSSRSSTFIISHINWNVIKQKKNSQPTIMNLSRANPVRKLFLQSIIMQTKQCFCYCFHTKNLGTVPTENLNWKSNDGQVENCITNQCDISKAFYLTLNVAFVRCR